MLSRRAKAAFYSMAGPLMWLNGRVYRGLRAPRATGTQGTDRSGGATGLMGAAGEGGDADAAEGARVHLGPGQSNYLNGWINVDANIFSGKADAWIDLRHPLPFRSDSIRAFYSHHVIEHLPDLRGHLEEVYRCLRPGGVYRMGGPNGDSAIAKYAQGDAQWFPDFPDSRQSLGGRLENFIFCRQEHLTILTYSFLEEMLLDIGFVGLSRQIPTRETTRPDLFNDCLEREWETDFDFPHTLLIEASKPGGSRPARPGENAANSQRDPSPARQPGE